MTPFAVTLVLISALMHAGWNMVLRNQRSTNMFLSMSIVLVVVALAPALLAELIAPSVIVPVWTQIVLGGCCLGIYYLGMTNSYRGGDFTVAYPLARALPVVIVACAELFLGTPPTLVGWIGILLIAGGAVILPLQSVHELHIARYWNRTTLWILFSCIRYRRLYHYRQHCATGTAQGPGIRIALQRFRGGGCWNRVRADTTGSSRGCSSTVAIY